MMARRAKPVAAPEEPLRDEDAEILLVGGTANRGQVVRVGNTVRRPQRPTSPATHALLRHLADVGFGNLAPTCALKRQPDVEQVPVLVQQMSQLTGQYQLESGSLEVQLADGELMLGGASLRPVGPDQFVLETDLDTRISFTNQGADRRLLIEREGQRTEGQRRTDGG